MGEWQHGLCGCFDNLGLCIISYFVPCYQFGKNAEAIGDSCFMCALGFLCIPCIVGTIERGKIRSSRQIPGSIVTDALFWLFCPLCALVQEAQEVQGMSVQSIARE